MVEQLGGENPGTGLLSPVCTLILHNASLYLVTLAGGKGRGALMLVFWPNNSLLASFSMAFVHIKNHHACPIFSSVLSFQDD